MTRRKAEQADDVVDVPYRQDVPPRFACGLCGSDDVESVFGATRHWTVMACRACGKKSRTFVYDPCVDCGLGADMAWVAVYDEEPRVRLLYRCHPCSRRATEAVYEQYKEQYPQWFPGQFEHVPLEIPLPPYEEGGHRFTRWVTDRAMGSYLSAFHDVRYLCAWSYCDVCSLDLMIYPFRPVDASGKEWPARGGALEKRCGAPLPHQLSLF